MLRRHEGINQGGLADLLEVEPITVCRMVDRLQEGELVERRAHPTDRRTWCLFLTPKAEAMLDQLRPVADSVFADALDGIDRAEQAALLKTLAQIRQNLARRLDQTSVSHG